MKLGEIVTATSIQRYGQGNAIHVKDFTLEVDGIEDLIKQFATLGDDAIYRLSEPSTQAANVVLEKAQNKVPVRTGKLWVGLKVTPPGRTKGKAYRVFAKVGFTATSMGNGKDYGVMHGVPLELGHKLVRNGNTIGVVSERPYLRPAADVSREEVMNIMVDAMNTIILEFTGR